MDLVAQPVLAASETANNLLFPLIILLVGAGVSGFLVPRIVSQREERRKAIELKTSFVAEISEAVMGFLMAIQFAELARRERPADAEMQAATRRICAGRSTRR
jgi:hypothetical protein